MATLNLELDIPTESVGWTEIPQKELTSEIKKILAVYLYSKKSLPLHHACKLAGVSKWEFFDINKEFRVPVPYDIENLEQDRDTLRRLNR